MQEGKFSLKKKTSFKDIKDGNVPFLPESDLCFQDGENIYQFEFKRPEDDRQFDIEPGTFVLANSQEGVILKKIELKQRFLLESVSNTSRIMKEAHTFFNKLHIYDKLNRPKKRGVLLYSNPGMGKTSAIEKVCLDLLKEDPGTVVAVWPTSEIEADDIVKLLTVNSKYKAECTRMVLVIEDIGGGESERHRSSSGVDSGLLNLLDGVGMIFRLPTFIIATTNHPESLLASLADRPGRFDLMLKLQAPSLSERIELLQFIAKRALSSDEIDALAKKGTEKFSIAHLEEIAVRAELHDKTYSDVIDELIKHQELFNKDFEDRETRMGISFD